MTIEVIKKRRSIREYSSDQVADEAIAEIVKAAQFARTAANNCSVEFIIVRDPGTKANYAKLPARAPGRNP